MTRKKRNTSMQPHAAVATLEDSHWSHWRARQRALETLGKLEPTTLALYADAVVAWLTVSFDWCVRVAALQTLGTLEPRTLVQYAADVIARLEDDESFVRRSALETLAKLEPATLVQYAGVVVARLEDPSGDYGDWRVRKAALETLSRLAQSSSFAQHAFAVVAMLEDSDWQVRQGALKTLGELKPATLAWHADAVVARLTDSAEEVRFEALRTLGELEPATLVQYANAALARLEDDDNDVRDEAMLTLHALPRFVTRPVGFFDCRGLRSRLLGRIGWYRCRLRLRVRSLALYWYALPYRPSGPGHARDVEAWDRMDERSRCV